MVKPTDEQEVAVERFLTQRPLKIAAFAGSGKTTTLRLLAEATPRRGTYLAFNKAIAAEAKEKFPRSVDCRTTHSLAHRAIRPDYPSQSKMMDRMFPKQLAAVMGYRDRAFGLTKLNEVQQAYMVSETVRRFCYSDDPAIERKHVPVHGKMVGLDNATLSEVRGWVADQAKALWARMVDRSDSTPLGHDGYLKLWGLREPTIASDFILLDEAQDTNEVVLGVLRRQDAQIVYVGDKYQQIYDWRGAINAMEKIDGCEEAYLTQSFRFGSQIATKASLVLSTLGESRSIRGNPAVTSSIAEMGSADAVLTRTNATIVAEILQAKSNGQLPCVVGGTKELERLLSDVYDLKAGKPGVSPEFFGFQNWSEVVAFAESEEGQDLRMFVRLVEQHGEAKLWAAVKSATDDEGAGDVILSTAHKAKGREWDSVRLAPDFMGSTLGAGPSGQAEVRLFYVAMTRAKRRLVVDNAMLELFTTDAWKTYQPGEGASTRPAQEPSRSPKRPRPAGTRAAARPASGSATVREITPTHVTSKHPAAIPSQPEARGAKSARGVIESTSDEARSKHPGWAASFDRSSSKSDTPPVSGSADPKPKMGGNGFWKKVASLFGGN